jgi:DivIVA domain-containing protein
MTEVTPELRALYALDRNLPRGDLPMAAQLEYDRLRPAWEQALYALDRNLPRGDLPMAAQLEYDRLRLAWERGDPALLRSADEIGKGMAVTVSEEEQDETQARINHIEAIIKKSLGWAAAVFWIFLIIAIPDPAAGETDQDLPAWMWLGIGIAGVMLLLTVLAFKTDVPRRIAEIITTHRPGHKARPMTGEQVRDTTFLITRGGYDVAEVDDLLRSIAQELDVGRPVEPLARNATFRTRRRGYDVAAVDSFLGQFLLRPAPGELAEMSTDPWRGLDAVGGQVTRRGAAGRAERSGKHGLALRERYHGECRKAWDEFDQQPGTYLRLEWVGIARRELHSAEQQTIASMTYRWYDPILGNANISEIGGQFSINQESFVLKCTGYAQSRKLADKTGTPILYTSGMNFERIAKASVSFPDGRSLRFPVQGTHRANAIMTAVDGAGNSVARYRIIRFSTGGLGRKSVEVVVLPGWELTNELMLAIMISAPWLRSYFSVQRGGG